jgi:hypothetical protein
MRHRSERSREGRGDRRERGGEARQQTSAPAGTTIGERLSALKGLAGTFEDTPEETAEPEAPAENPAEAPAEAAQSSEEQAPEPATAESEA